MYVTSMVLEGFKSYGQRTEINGFDREFNAITGLNGSGKSNILDAICFVLGISNLGQVRAGTLQDLVYKSGQAGITKASVTITFNNQDKKQSPLGYEQHADITVTRQVIMGGKNKYMINGSNVQNKKVQDLFCSVQLNVNNPHFLIMQGRITKVLNMKPPEILSMIEEAAGTRMYECKKQAAQKTIQKKDDKLREINTVVEDDINPKLQKLKDERSQYLEYTRVQQELKRLTKIFVAWKFVSAKETTKKAADELQQIQLKIDATLEKVNESTSKIQEIDASVVELSKKRDSESGGKLEALENRLVECVNIETKASVLEKSIKDTINSENKKKKQLEKCLSEDETALAAKEQELQKVEGFFQALKDNDEADSVALAAAQSKFQAVSSGLFAKDDGTDATLQDQLMGAKQEIAEAETELKQAEMQLKHCHGSLKDKSGAMKQTATEYQKDQRELQNMEKELPSLERELGALNYEDGRLEQLQAQKQTLLMEICTLKEKINPFEAKHPQLNFRYKDPEPNFRHTSVKGLVCKLFKVKNPLYSTALEVAAGGRLFNVIVDSEMTSKKLLQKGQLQYRTTIIPLNKIHGYSIDQNTVSLAQKMGGKENVHPALALIEYSQEYHPAMQWVFGQTLICKDLDTAKKVTFHDRIMKRSVTLEGDVVDPGGTLSGGASKKGGSLLNQLEELRVAQEEKTSKEEAIARIDAEIRNLTKVAERYGNLKQHLELRQYEVELVRKKLQQTTHHQHQEEVNTLKNTIAELEKMVKKSKQVVQDGVVKVKDLEYKVKNAKTIKEHELKSAEKEMNRLKKKAEGSRTQWKQREQEFETLKLEITELKTGIEAARAQIVAAEEALIGLMQQTEEAAIKSQEYKIVVKEIRAEVKAQKEVISQKNVEIQKMLHLKEKLVKSNREADLEMKKLEHENTNLQSEVVDCESRVNELLKNHEWLKSDNQYLGDSNEMYNLEDGDPHEVGKRIAKLEEVKEKLGRNINTRAINLLDKEEEQFNDLMRKKRIVDNDKAKIVSVIESLDVKKKEALRHACEQVNKDFGSIFSTLLPGAHAKLQPPDGMDVLDGLEVKVGFGDIWKESLGELSGGQRSLVALSLILAMLLFNPAPIYILDEVDAALDLSHTQNIGNMLKSHFKHSQFIVVSLKDGMFNNANVLFRTKFVDGMSTVGRTVQHLNTNSTEPQSSKNSKTSKNKRHV